MTLQICLMEDDNVLFSLALPRRASGELPFLLSERELDRLSTLYSIGSNRKRLRVMMELAKGGELRFSEVMQLVTNPKLAQDSLKPMVGAGLVLHEKGLGYKPSETGLRVLLVLTLGLGRILALVEGEMGDELDE
jgi:hypothetical protein